MLLTIDIFYCPFYMGIFGHVLYLLMFKFIGIIQTFRPSPVQINKYLR